MNVQRDPYLPYIKDPRVLAPFDEKKEILRDLYLDQNLQLKEVKEAMEESHAFPQFEISWYENILQNHLGLRKNLKKGEWAVVNYHIGKRKRDSEVFLCGIKKPNDRKRQKLPQINRQRMSRSPSLPWGVTIRTPPPLSALSVPPKSTDRLHSSAQQDMFPRVLLRKGFGTPKQYKPSPWWSEIMINSPSAVLIRTIQNFLGPDFKAREFADFHLGGIENPSTQAANISPRHTSMVGISRAQFYDISVLLRACIAAANGTQWHSAGISLEELFQVISEPGSYNMIKGIFSLNLPAVTSFWGLLMGKCAEELDRTRRIGPSEDLVQTVRTLTFIGLEIHEAKLIRIYNIESLKAVIMLGIQDSAELLERLLINGASPNADHPSIVEQYWSHLSKHQRLIHGTDLIHAAVKMREPMLIETLIHHGAALKDSHETASGPLEELLGHLRRWYTNRITSKDIACAEILLKAGYKVDDYLYYCEYRPNDYCWDEFQRNAIISSSIYDWCFHQHEGDYIRPVYLIDAIFDNTSSEELLTQKYRLYDVIYKYSRRVQESVTIPGILSAASISTVSIQQYLAAREQPPREKSFALELALLKATQLPGSLGVESVRRILEAGADPNMSCFLEVACESPMWEEILCDPETNPIWYPVWVVTHMHDINMLTVLVQHGASINICNCLAAVAEQGTMSSSPPNSLAVLKFLLEKGADIGEFGTDAMLATIFPRRPRLRDRTDDPFIPNTLVYAYLRDCGVKLDMVLIEEIFLEKLVLYRRRCSVKLVEFLISEGLSLRSIIQQDSTVLKAVGLWVSEERVPMLHLLLDHGAGGTVDSLGREFLRDLLIGGCDLDDEDRFELLSLFARMLRSGARTDADALLFFLIQTTDPIKGHADITLTLEQSDGLVLETLEAGAKIDGTEMFGDGSETSTPLASAIMEKRYELARELVNRGADINLPSGKPRSRTPLQAACDTKLSGSLNMEFINHLLDSGAQINAPAYGNEGLTALQAATWSGSQDVICLLIDRGADVNATNENDDNRDMDVDEGNWYITALDQASGQGRLDIVHQLVEAGGWSGKPGETGFDGAIELAEKARHFAISEMLKKKAETEGQQLRYWHEIRTKLATDLDDMVNMNPEFAGSQSAPDLAWGI